MADALRYPNALDILAARKNAAMQKTPYDLGQAATVFGIKDANRILPQTAIGMYDDEILKAKYAQAIDPASKIPIKIPWKELSDDYLAAHLAENYSPLAKIGFDPSKMSIDVVDRGKLNLGGLTDHKTGQMFSTMEFPSSMIHEAIHNGINTLRRKGLIPKSLENRLPDEESIVRYVMAMQMGDPEKGEGDVGDAQRALGLLDFGKLSPKENMNYSNKPGMTDWKNIPKEQKIFDDRKRALGELYKIASTYLDAERQSSVAKKSGANKESVRAARVTGGK